MATKAPVNTHSTETIEKNAEQWPRVLFHKRIVGGKEVRKLYPFNPKNIVFDPPVRSRFGSECVHVHYHLIDKEDEIDKIVPLVVQTPEMSMPFGISEKDAGTYVTRDLTLSFRDSEVDPEIASFLSACEEWDRVTVKTLQDKLKTWFPSTDYTPESIPIVYKFMSNPRKRKRDGKVFAAALKCKIKKARRSDESFALKVYQSQDDKDSPPALVDMSTIQQGSKGSVLMRHGGLWFVNNQITNSLIAMQVKLTVDSNELMFTSDECALVEH